MLTTNTFFSTSLFLIHLQSDLSVNCGCLGLLPAHWWQLSAKSFQGVVGGPKDGAQVEQIGRSCWNVWDSSTALLLLLNKPSPPTCTPPPSALAPLTLSSLPCDLNLFSHASLPFAPALIPHIFKRWKSVLRAYRCGIPLGVYWSMLPGGPLACLG